MPERVQLSRKAGWRMPPNTVRVARPGKWGNPITKQSFEDAQMLLQASGLPPLKGTWQQHAVKCYEGWLGGELPEFGQPPTVEEIISELRGKNLACWCRPGTPCHADVLLEIANG